MGNVWLQVRSDDTAHGGESWLWTQGHFRAVIDIGEAAEFHRRAAAFSPNVVVFTHDDSDHIGKAGAAVSFLEEVGRGTCDYTCYFCIDRKECGHFELWLPMDWLHLGRAALQVMEAEAGINGDEAVEGPTVENETDPEYTLHFFGSQADSGNARLGEYEDERICPNVLPEMYEGLADLSVEELKEVVEGSVNDYRNGTKGKLPGTPKEIANRAAESAKRVGAILAAAARLKIPVRFFDVDLAVLREKPLWCESGIPGHVTVINAVEVPGPTVEKFKDPARALLFASRLTVQNRRALATFLWPSSLMVNDGALIWSDTEGSVCGQPPTSKMVPWRYISVMSAPHHASDVAAHRPLWDYRPPSVRVVLSNNKQADTPAWRAVPKAYRACASCGFMGRTVVAAFTDRQSGELQLQHHCVL